MSRRIGPHPSSHRRSFNRWAVVISILSIGVIASLPDAAGEASSANQPGFQSPQPSVRAVIASMSFSPQKSIWGLNSDAPVPKNRPDGLTVINPENIADIQPVHVLRGHNSDITALAISPDSAIIATSSVSGEIRVWDAKSGDLIRAIAAHPARINSLAFSPDGSLLASGSDDESVRLWDVDEGSLVNTIESRLAGRILAVRFTPDGRYIAMAGHKCLSVLRDVQTGILFKSYKSRNCFPRSGGTVESWGIDFTEDGDEIILGVGQPGCNCGSIQRWDVKVIAANSLIYGYGIPVKDLDLSPDDTYLAVAMIGTNFIRLIDADNVYPIKDLKGHFFRVNSVQFSPDGRLLASASNDQRIGIWDPEAGQLLRFIHQHTDAVMDIQFSPDGTFLASGSNDDLVIIWEITTE